MLTAEQWGWDIATEASLKVLLHRWENEQRVPNETYRVLLCSIFRVTPEALGFAGERKAKAATTVAGRGRETQELRERVELLEDLVRELAERLMNAEAAQ